jgi:peptidoglycan/LPS O-acetylase OafA/YrhL
MLSDLDRRDTTILKGLGIAAIVFHNFFHLVSPVQANEFAFDPSRFLLFLETARHSTLLIQAFFSFFGHFGLQLFIFLSAYGLAKSHWDDSPGWIMFMWSRVKKLYPMFLLVYFVWLILVSTQVGLMNAIRNSSLELGCMLTGLSNILPGHHMLPVGPWWFIPFIIQFYAIWPLLQKFTVRFGWRGLILLATISLSATYIANPLLAPWGTNLFETPIARMPVLCFGIAAARYPIRIPAGLAVIAFTVLIIGSLYRDVWPLTFSAALIVLLFLYITLRGRLRNSRVLQVVGSYSMLLFLWNGVVRVPFVSLATSPASQLALGCVSAAVTLAIVVVIRETLTLIDSYPATHPREALNWQSSATRVRIASLQWSSIFQALLSSSESGYAATLLKQEQTVAKRLPS